MPEHTLNDNPTAKAISPKVSFPLIAGVVSLIAETAVTQNWDETNWLGSGLVVLYAVVGYLVNDPARVTT